MEKFRKALENKYRYSYKGTLSTEDLFDLSVEELDSIYKKLNKQKKEQKEDSLLGEKIPKSTKLDIKIEIIKEIVNQKLKERDDLKKAQETRMKKQKIMEILASKQDDALNNKTPEELEAMLNDL